MEKINRLCSLAEGKSARVKCLRCEDGICCRLRDLGFIEGSAIICLNRRLNGGIGAYLIKGSVIALRQEDSSNILVEAV